MSNGSPPLTTAAVQVLCAANGAAIEAPAATQLTAFLELLVTWNKSMNLVGKKQWPEILVDLLLDSWHLARFLETLPLPAACLTYDLGAGAGIPGVPLRIFWPRGTYTLVELRSKRVVFLRYALAKLANGLQGQTLVYEGRAEDILAGRAPDLIVSRAFKPWREILELTGPCLSKAEPGASARFVAFMASTPAPALPAGWRLTADMRYAARGKDRYFWALSPESLSTRAPR